MLRALNFPGGPAGPTRWMANLARGLIAMLLVGSLAPADANPYRERKERKQALEDRKTRRMPGEYIIRASRGSVQRAGGSYLRHEKAYERALWLRSISGDLEPLRLPHEDKPVEVPLHVYKSTFVPDDVGNLGVEYHLSPLFSAGIQLNHHTLTARRQESVTFSSDSRTFLEPLPTESTALKLNAALLQFSVHTPPRGSFDPYVTLRSGAVAYTGEAHEFQAGDPYRFDNTIPNGRGYVLEGAAGVNLYLNAYTGMTLETGYSNYVLSSDLFQDRTYGISYLSLGFFVTNLETGLNL